MELTPDLLLNAYAAGIFPMSDSRDDPEIFWVDPRERGILPLDGFHLSRSLRKTIRQSPHQVYVDRDFAAVVQACAARDETWINDTIYDLYMQLHQMGYAHSIEIWDGDELIGGCYGVALMGAFFGESMFSRRRDASKIALAYLVDRLRQGGYRLLDTQFLTPHLASLGGVEIPRAHYRTMLANALRVAGHFNRPATPSPQELVQRMTQTS
ncbi:leucyl/phenylalanyl-tRNA--protein transferase [Actibacterium sp. XHP0104]|uniref:leucyl/phenylalanyl-tRNA--protein transferase n=1 Tax=Actibacterium sp. XHP0104 TaxID=2984335 RepID=UPI0021E96DF1|nr:leucyl/phenylalanyl-tRNA--protein transferase [Actibacterium sp. XHP0104]MCV2880647.1 leucyl/phenylalanyl-tRNA--protein transferase [Actibacterium sp. XHP0104]